MEANEINSQAVMFIKKYGWDKVKEILDGIKIEVSFDGRVCDPCFISEDGDYVSCGELEAFYKSYKLIERDFGLLSIAEYEYMISASYSEPYWIRVKQAIKDVESCL